MKVINEGATYSKDVYFKRRPGPVENGSPPFWGEIALFWPTIQPYFTKDKKILEIGPAYWPIPVLKENLTVIDKLKEHEESLLKAAGTVFIGDGLQIASKLPDKSFDIVAAFHCLEHMLNPEITIKVWWEKVKPHGFMMIATPVVWYYPSIQQEGGNKDHKDDYTLAKLLSIMLNSCISMEVELAQVRGDHELQNESYQKIYGDTVVSYKKDRCCLVVARRLKT